MSGRRYNLHQVRGCTKYGAFPMGVGNVYVQVYRKTLLLLCRVVTILVYIFVK